MWSYRELKQSPFFSISKTNTNGLLGSLGAGNFKPALGQKGLVHSHHVGLWILLYEQGWTSTRLQLACSQIQSTHSVPIVPSSVVQCLQKLPKVLLLLFETPLWIPLLPKISSCWTSLGRCWSFQSHGC